MKVRPYIDEETETRETCFEIIGKTISHALVTIDSDPETRGIGCATRARLNLFFTDGTAADFFITGDFGPFVTKPVNVRLSGVMAYPK